MELRERLTGTWQALPIAHRIGVVAAIVGLLMGAFMFVQWVSAPSYTVLASNLDDADVGEVVDLLESEGVAYEIGGGGTTVLVPRQRLYTTRAALAQAGVDANATPGGYELLDEQGLTVSDFRQQVDYKRALEGELAKTLMAMDGVDSATVHLVLPDEELFTEQRKPTTASVLLDTGRELNATEVEAVTFLVSSSVEGLETSQITVANSDGTVLHAPGDTAGAGGTTNRQLRQTREFEQSLAGDITTLLARATGSPASVVVRAELNFDETSVESVDYDPDSQVVIKEQTEDENYEGTGVSPGGTVGVDGGPLPDADGEATYEREEVLREYGVDNTTTVTNRAPGQVEGLSVAIVMDDGSVTGATVPDVDEVEQLVAAAVGLDQDRGDTVAVTPVPFPDADEETEEPNGTSLTAMIPQIVGGLVLLVVAVGLFLMTRRRKQGDDPSPAPASNLGLADDTPAEEPAPEPRPAPERPDDGLKREVSEMVDRQPEEVATLLRGWLADSQGK